MVSTRPLRLIRRPVVEEIRNADAEQEQVIATVGMPLLVTGGPGTGKTATLVASAISRISNGQNADSLLILAYGRERASQIRDKIALGSGATTLEPLARTFHSLAFSILNDVSAEDPRRYVLISGAEQDSFIRDLLASEITATNIDWPAEIKLALPTRGFAKEIRDLILRATERGYTPETLTAKGKELNERFWSAAADFWLDYQNAMTSQSLFVADAPYRIDPSEVISEAIHKLVSDPKLLARYRKKFTTILVDEFQESDKAQRALLKLIAPADLVIFADADSAVGRFRGADPEGVADFADELACASVTLVTNHRSNSDISQFSEVLIGATRKLDDTEIKVKASGIQAISLSNQSECANVIAHTFRSAHLREGIPWSEMAVIVRSPGGQIASLQRAFALNSIPVSIESDALALADNPAIKPFLLVAQIALGIISLRPSYWPEIQELLLSEIGGADSLSLRQIRTAMAKARQVEFSEGEKSEDDSAPAALPTVTEMILEAIDDPTLDPSHQFLPLYRIGSLIRAAKKSQKMKGSISDLLWAIWSNAQNFDGQLISQAWRDRALQGGARGAAADRDLDAMMELFESARRFSDRMPGSSAQQFLNQVLGEKILGDTITAKGQRENVVSIMTVHSAKGQEWEIVALAGLQEGVWPNLRQRGSLLGSERLVEADRSQVTAAAQLLASTSSALAKDERRLLHVAVSRAKSRLLITSFHSEDSEPSSYFDEITSYLDEKNGEAENSYQIPRSLTQQALVSALRRQIRTSHESESAESEAQFSAGLLKTLATAGIWGANPDNWLGLADISSNDPIVAPGNDIYVSPSNLQSFSECGLKWFLEKSGGRDGESTAQILGSAIHALAAQLMTSSEITLPELQKQLESAWTLVDAGKGWVNDQQYGKAAEMLEKFFDWHREDLDSRKLLGTEVSFKVRIGSVILNGSVDRLELTAEGELFIVDLKTGKSSSVILKDIKDHKQLMGYQLAVLEGGFTEFHPEPVSGGAELVFLGDDGSFKTRPQGKLVHEEMKAEVIAMGAEMAAATFVAKINKRCSNCGVKSSCPIQTQGRSVMDK